MTLHTFRLALLCLSFGLSACMAPPRPEAARATATDFPLPPARSFGAMTPTPPQRSNAEMTRDFLDLSFQLENGREIVVFSRFEEPVTIGMAGAVPPSARSDLSRLLGRLRSEAGIDITEVSTGAPAITIEFLPRQKMQKYVPRAACFVVPRVSSWREYLTARRDDLDWTTLARRDRAAIFVPNDTSPQEIRDCLHEELAQALGPLNDLYRLPDSVFNDDNIHTVLTGFDMLMLRVTYAPELASGLTRDAVALQVPAILDRLNPRGRGGGAALPSGPTPRAFSAAIDTALGPGAAPVRRRAAARTAVEICVVQGWHDARAGFAWMAVGRLALGHDPDVARLAFTRASEVFHNNPYLTLHAANSDMQLAAFALVDGNADEALRLTNTAMPAAMAAQNASLLASLMMIKAEALEMSGRASEARQVRLDSLGWARYGFGSDAEVRKHLQGLASLVSAQGTKHP
ncbi:MAG: DUF2927 domain-containing protein [Albidovulum sp.]